MKHTENEATPDYLDVIYTNRHKAYGSYELRRHYPARLKLAMFLLTGAVAVLASIPLLGSNKPQPVALKPILKADTLTFFSHDIRLPEKPRQPKTALPAKSKVATQDFSTPKIVRDELAKKPMPPVDSLTGKEISNATKAGDGTSGNSTTAHTGGTSGNGSSGAAARPEVNIPIRIAEKAPSPPYSVDDFLAKNLRYPEAAREQGQEGKVVVEFVVHEDGHIGQPKILKSAGKALDAEALRVLSLMPAWMPGMQGGKAVKVYFVLPITFRLD